MTREKARAFSKEEELEVRQIAESDRDTWRKQILDFCSRNKRTTDKDYRSVYAKVNNTSNRIAADLDRQSRAESTPAGRNGRKYHASPLGTGKELSVSANEIRFTVKALRIESNGKALEFVVEI